MNALAGTVLLALIAGASSCTRSSDAGAALSDTVRKTVTDSVNAVADGYFAAASRRDADRALSFFSPTATSLEGGEIHDWSWSKALEDDRAFYASLRSLEAHALAHGVDVLTQTVGVWHGQYSYTLVDTAGQTTRGIDAITFVTQRGPAGWRIVHRHESTSPPPVKK